MIDKVMIGIADVFHGAGSLLEGIFGRQPKPEELRRQVESFQVSADQLKQIFQQQNDEIERMIANYRALKFHQVFQKSALKQAIQDELVCQYAALDYLTILINAVESGAKLSREDLDFYYAYCKMFADGRIDSDEMVELRPVMLQRHAREIDALHPCDLSFVLDRIKNYRH